MRDTFSYIFTFIGKNKYILAAVPLVFGLFFVFSLQSPHQGSLKTSTYSYSGRLLNGQPQGTGSLIYADGDRYTGTFKAGEFSGQGTFTSKSGKWTYSGNFSDGQPDGQGTLKTADSKSHTVKYKNGVLVK